MTSTPVSSGGSGVIAGRNGFLTSALNVTTLVSIFVVCVLSFVPSLRYDANLNLMLHLTDAVVRPFRRLLPPIAGFDFSFWAASIALILARMLIVAPLSDLAMRLG